MSQQINLYNPALAPKVELFSGQFVLLGLAVIFGLSVLGWALVAYDLSRMVVRERAQAAQLLKVQGEVTSLAQQVAARKPSAQLETELANLDASLGARNAVMIMLDSGALGDTRGVSAYFRAFANQSTQGLWLTGFSIVGAGNDIEIQGRALDADLVPAYLRKLRREDLLRGHGFESVTVFRPPEPSAQGHNNSTPRFMEFRLSTAQGKEAAGLRETDRAGRVR
jgi:Tfp pilus assembly protein PilN